MMQIVEQRKYVQGFLDFVGSFLITEKATISELDLVESNLEILRDRIRLVKSKTEVGSSLPSKEAVVEMAKKNGYEAVATPDGVIETIGGVGYTTLKHESWNPKN